LLVRSGALGLQARGRSFEELGRSADAREVRDVGAATSRERAGDTVDDTLGDVVRDALSVGGGGGSEENGNRGELHIGTERR